MTPARCAASSTSTTPCAPGWPEGYRSGFGSFVKKMSACRETLGPEPYLRPRPARLNRVKLGPRRQIGAPVLFGINADPRAMRGMHLGAEPSNLHTRAIRAMLGDHGTDFLVQLRHAVRRHR